MPLRLVMEFTSTFEILPECFCFLLLECFVQELIWELRAPIGLLSCFGLLLEDKQGFKCGDVMSGYLDHS